MSTIASPQGCIVTYCPAYMDKVRRRILIRLEISVGIDHRVILLRIQRRGSRGAISVSVGRGIV